MGGLSNGFEQSTSSQLDRHLERSADWILAYD
jgi:hypothetical protein